MRFFLSRAGDNARVAVRCRRCPKPERIRGLERGQSAKAFGWLWGCISVLHRVFEETTNLALTPVKIQQQSGGDPKKRG